MAAPDRKLDPAEGAACWRPQGPTRRDRHCRRQRDRAGAAGRPRRGRLRRGGQHRCPRAALLRAGILCVGVRLARRAVGVRVAAAAEDGGEEAAFTGGGPFGLRGFEIADARFQLANVVAGRFKALFLHDHGLGEIIGGGGLGADLVGDERFGLAVARRAACGAHAIEEGGEKLAFFR